MGIVFRGHSSSEEMQNSVECLAKFRAFGELHKRVPPALILPLTNVVESVSSTSHDAHHCWRESTGAPRSPKRTPDFLSSLLALANLMRLSLSENAYAGVGGAPCRKSGYVGRKRWAQPNDRFRCTGRQIHINRSKTIKFTLCPIKTRGATAMP